MFIPRVYYIDVGQGDSSLIRYKNKIILIDTGGNYHKELYKDSIQFFKSIGVKKIDYLILTHGDFDHMGEAINLVNNFKVEKVIFNCGEYNDLEQELIKVLDKKKINYYSCIEELKIDKNKLYFLQTKEYDNENDNSNVIYTELNGYKFMLMGDAGVEKENDILDKYDISDIDVLKVGHHGSKTSSSKEFIKEINPNYSIISVGKNNRYGHPNKEVLDNLKQSKIYRTDQDGSIMFKIKNNKLKIEACSPLTGVDMNYYNEIKNELINNEINRKVKNYSINKSDLDTYYNVGKLLLDAGNQYGESIIKEYSLKLTEELGLGYSQRNLRNMRQFYKLSQKRQTLSAKLSWSHYCEILWFDENKFQYYAKIAELNNLSIRQLRTRIKSKEYERLPESTKNKLIKQDESNVIDFVKNPIVIKNSNKYDIFSEKVLQKLILEDIENFLDELGNGFTFIKSEYPIKLGNRYNYIDLLLYNIKYKCYVVVELKVTELKKEHTGQIMTYMNYIDKNIKTIEENNTVGIIICKQDNEYVIKYCSDDRIIARGYELV